MMKRQMFNRLGQLSAVAMMVIGAWGAQAKGATGSITGLADPGAQVVVLGTDSGDIAGAVAKCDGTYRVEGLKPGKYSIRESGEHHAARKLEVKGGEESHVDLAAEGSFQSKCTK